MTSGGGVPTSDPERRTLDGCGWVTDEMFGQRLVESALHDDVT